jgi:hypothetical protein
VAPVTKESSASWTHRAAGIVAVTLPFGFAVARGASSGQWRDDLPAVRDLGLVAVGVGGGPSTVVTQVLSLLPLGSHAFRAALGSAVALAVASWLLYRLCLRLLLGTRTRPVVAAVLSGIAALTASLSPTWQREATVGGGAMLAVCLTLATLWVTSTPLGARAARAPVAPIGRLDAASRAVTLHWIGLGALAGAAFAESPPAALAALAGASAMVVAERSRPASLRPRFVITELPARLTLVASICAFVATATLLLAPALLRPAAPRSWADLGLALSAASLSAPDVASTRTTALAAWSREIGLLSLGIAAFGMATGLARPVARSLMAPLVVLILLDTLLPARAAGVLSTDPLTSLRALAVAAIAMGSAFGVCTVVDLLLRLRLPMARSGAVLIVMFHLTLVALTSEEAAYVANRHEQFGAEEWADSALGRLEPDSAILVQSPAIAWRLWAARLTRGERPDVLVIPVGLLDRGRIAANLLNTEREIEPLLRDFALTGAPSEFALSKLADVRPLHVELDRTWSKRLIAHLTIDGLWLEFAPQPLGQSDRKRSTSLSMVPIRRVIATIGAPTVPDGSTSSVVSQSLRAQAAVLSSLGEYEASQGLLDRIAELAPDPYATGVSVRHGIARAAWARRQLISGGSAARDL